MAYFNTCPNCGCNLDPGEKCDCEDEKKKLDDFMEKHTRVAAKTGQMAFVWNNREAAYAQKIVS